MNAETGRPARTAAPAISKPRLPFANMPPRRAPDDPGQRLERMLWLLVQFLRHGAVDKRTFKGQFNKGPGQFSRDIRDLRNAGRFIGLRLSASQRGTVRLENREAAMNGMPGRGLARLLQTLADALGPPVASVVASQLTGAAMGSSFYHLSVPRFAADHQIAAIYADLERAYEAQATVAFTYTTKHRVTAERNAEPHCVIQHGGRYYLVAYCHARRDWRFFALDGISGNVRRVGTAQKPRVPDFDLDASIGFIRGDQPPTPVTVRIAPELAAAIRSQRWQAEQRIEADADGGLRLTVVVTDFAEIARWSMSFGDQATVVGPPAAVAIARHLLEASLAKYRPLRRRSNIA